MSNIYTDPPQSRNEAIIKSTIDGTQYTDPPQSRMEDLLLDLKEVIEGGGGGGTTVVANPEGEATDELEKLQVGSDIYGIPKDYSELDNKPSINSVPLSGNKTASELGLQDELDGAQTVSGNPITVADAEPMNAESVVVELEPKQDLHGYDAPWVGGAGKNKLPLVLADIKALNTEGTWSGNVYSVANGTFEILTDNDGNIMTIKANGTFNEQILFYIKGRVESQQSIIYSGVEGGSESTYGINVYTNGAFLGDVCDGDSIVHTLSANTYYTYIIFIRSGYSASNLTFYPMIRLSTETDADFEPYSNICPISGYSEVEVERVGKNWAVLDVSHIQSINGHQNDSETYTDNGVTVTSTGNYGRCGFEAKVVQGATYTISMKAKKSASVGGGGILIGSTPNWDYEYIKFGDNQITTDFTVLAQTITAETDTLYIGVYPITSGASITVENLQLELGSTATAYEPYQGDTYTIDLDGTRYGGTLDVTEGKFIDDHGYATINYASLVDGLFRAQAPSGVNWSYPSCKCSCLEVWDTVNDLADNYGISYDDGYFYMNLPPECGETESAVQTWLQNNPIGVVYVTRDVTEESTTPTDIPLLENTNNISTDGTNITLKYQPNNVIGECKAYTDEQIEKVLPPLPTTDGTYHLSCEVTSGVGVLSWVSDS